MIFRKANEVPLSRPGGRRALRFTLDDEVLGRFKMAAERTGKGYQTLINACATGTSGHRVRKPLTAKQVREILREELGSRTGS